MANLNSESCHSLIGFLTAEYLGFLKLQVVPRFTGTGISPVPVNRGILTSLLANFFGRSDLFPLSVSLITSVLKRGKMDADKGKRSLRTGIFASHSPFCPSPVTGECASFHCAGRGQCGGFTHSRKYFLSLQHCSFGY
jgi:hypothetical protein